MELFSGKSRCCGCMACADICPQNAISIKADREGFLYPKIKQKLCVNCKLCKTVCPLLHPMPIEQPRRYLAAQAKELRLRETSTSGAVFPLLAEYTLEQGGIVYGAGFDDSMRVVHDRIVSRDGLERLTQTKYVQSETAGIFRRVQQDLQMGKQVLFVGTPCQTEALRRFLGENKPNLLLADLVCYGVPSPGVWARYVSYLQKTYRGNLSEFRFRDKRARDNGHTISYKIGSVEHVERYDANYFASLYFSNQILRPSCHMCPFTTVERGSDITIGDFWGVENVFPGMDDGMGTSLVILHSPKANRVWDCLREQLFWTECTREAVLQPRLVSPTPQSPKRRLFFALYHVFPLGALVWMTKVRRLLHDKKQGLCRKLHR